MLREATRPHAVVNCPERLLYMAGYQVILHGRFWVFTEACDAALLFLAI